MDAEQRTLLSALCAATMAETARNDPDLDQKITAAEMMAWGYSTLGNCNIEQARLAVGQMLEWNAQHEVSRLRMDMASRRTAKSRRRVYQ